MVGTWNPIVLELISLICSTQKQSGSKSALEEPNVQIAETLFHITKKNSRPDCTQKL